MNRSAAALIGVAVAALPVVAGAMMVDIPLQIIGAQSELIVVGEATAAGEPLKITLQPPGYTKPVDQWFRTFTVKVSRVIKADGIEVKPGREITILTPAAEPRPQQGGPGMIMMDGPFYPSLRPGQSYVLALRTMKGKDELFLPGYPKNVRPAQEDEVKKMAEAADVAKWPWGDAKDGLQIAFIPQTKEMHLRVSFRREVQPDGTRVTRQQQTVYVNAVVALRNVGKKPLAVNLYPLNRFLSVRAAGPEGKVVSPELYNQLATMRLRPFGAWAVKVIAPGKIIFLTPTGEAAQSIGLNPELTEGEWKLSASFEGKKGTVPQAEGAEGKPAKLPELWTGTISSKPVQVKVPPLPQRGGIRVRPPTRPELRQVQPPTKPDPR